MTVNQFPVIANPNDATLVVIAGTTDAYGNPSPGYSSITGSNGGTSKPAVGVNITPTLVSGSYATGQYVGASGVAMVIPGAANYPGGGGFFSVIAEDPASVGVSGELWIFDAAVVPPNDHAAFALSSADLAHILPGAGGVIPFSTWYATAAKSVSPCPSILYPFKCAAGQTSLWACYVARGTYNPSAGAPTFRFTFWPD
jgi:hypothetical protein